MTDIECQIVDLVDEYIVSANTREAVIVALRKILERVEGEQQEAAEMIADEVAASFAAQRNPPILGAAMRINVYTEEITNRIEVVRKTAEGRDFVGLRFNLLTHENMIPPKHPDDDSSAVTFWFDDRAKAHEFVSQANERLKAALYL